MKRSERTFFTEFFISAEKKNQNNTFPFRRSYFAFTPKSSVLVPWDSLSTLHFHIFLVLLVVALSRVSCRSCWRKSWQNDSEWVAPLKRLFVENSRCPWGRCWSFHNFSYNQSKQDDVCWLSWQLLDPLILDSELILQRTADVKICTCRYVVNNSSINAFATRTRFALKSDILSYSQTLDVQALDIRESKTSAKFNTTATVSSALTSTTECR